MRFPPQSFVHQIAKQMRDQLQGYYLHPAATSQATAGKGVDFLAGIDPFAVVKSEQMDVGVQSSDAPDALNEDVDEELRILIKVKEIIVDHVNTIDCRC